MKEQDEERMNEHHFYRAHNSLVLLTRRELRWMGCGTFSSPLLPLLCSSLFFNFSFCPPFFFLFHPFLDSFLCNLIVLIRLLTFLSHYDPLVVAQLRGRRIHYSHLPFGITFSFLFFFFFFGFLKSTLELRSK